MAFAQKAAILSLTLLDIVPADKKPSAKYRIDWIIRWFFSKKARKCHLAIKASNLSQAFFQTEPVLLSLIADTCSTLFEKTNRFGTSHVSHLSKIYIAPHRLKSKEN